MASAWLSASGTKQTSSPLGRFRPIVSLVYVANQLDQNTMALQLSGVISTTEMWTEQQILSAENGELNAMF